MSELLALGVSHNTAPVALRERLALVDSQAVSLLHDLVADAAIAEAVVISTC
ncbi:MAG: glutamyl-tRNA reductase, partial [Solirubrobacterales bacterium]|nr:glutamyl-tRNA reductase [Solirubrobacterales bacterium]